MSDKKKKKDSGKKKKNEEKASSRISRKELQECLNCLERHDPDEPCPVSIVMCLMSAYNSIGLSNCILVVYSLVFSLDSGRR